MAETYKLAAQKREVSKKSARQSRGDKRIPGVIYGHGFDSQALSVDYSDFLRVFRRAGQAALIDLDVDGKNIKVVIHAYDLDPVQDTFAHIDFFAVNVKEAMTVHVPLTFVGESPAIKNLGGMFMKAHDAIDIRCLPTDIPHDIEVDISLLKEIGDHITIADLKLADNLELMHYEEDEMLCSVVAPRMAEEEDSDTAEDESGEEGGETEEGEEAEEKAD